MPFDLQTILVLRLCVELVVAGAFVVQARRHPTVGGPGWWAAAVVFSTLGSLGFGLRIHSLNLLTVSVANTLLCGAALFAWLGLRSYLGLPRSLRWTAAGLLAILLGQVLFYVVWDSAPARQALFALTGVVVRIGTLRDIQTHDPQRRQPVLQFLRWLTWGELLLLGFVGVAVWFVPDTSPARFGALVPSLLVFFMVDLLLRMVVSFSLVTARLQQESDRARQLVLTRETASRALVDNLSAGVMVFRPDQTLATINTAARRLLGWSTSGANSAMPEPQAPDWRLLREDGRPLPRHEIPFERVLATGQPLSNIVIGVQTGSGDAVSWVLCNAYPDNDALGGLRHVVFTFVDITSLKRAQQQQQALEHQLAQSHKMEALGTLAGGVAHDFNNILAAILGNADLARQDLPPGAPARESLHEISTAARRGRELVRQVQAFSRQQPMERRPVQVAEVVAESGRLLRAATASPFELVQTCADGVLPILADATQLSQVLLNLGTNAAHALEGRAGRIEYRIDALASDDPHLPAAMVQACAGNGAVRVQVQDNGCGMDKATRVRMFEPFFTTRVVGSGTGLGLPVVLGIVQAHGGAIEVDSEPGVGTTFTLYFPAVRALPAAVAETGLASDAGTMAANTSGNTELPGPSSVENPVMAPDAITEPRHILYLDDDDTLVFLVRRLLERRGYKVTAVTDQSVAIEAVRNQPTGFDLLMTDYNMPGMSGLEVARAVLAINPDLPVAVASGYITDELQVEALACGVREVVFKTDAVDAFCEVVARLVSPPRPA
ncbi:ATP-binding protein [Hydrogenophaga sp. ZJX-1]|uniref:ATP-binding protein n=1 Tax=Hydrogenophaga sp. ZJX-1 TaxID=3404778 RepID=UPI003B28527E